MFHQARRAKSDLCSRDRRQARRRVFAQLEAENLEMKQTLTELILDVNLQDQPEVFLPLLRESEGQDFLETLCCIWELCNSSQDIIMAAGRASKVVFALKTYASYGHSGELVAVDLVENLEAVLTLYASKLRSNVEVVRNYGDRLPPIQGNPEELSQVWMNLIHNALHAMEEKGKLLIEIQNLTHVLEVRITDSGCGIPPEILPQIFQPFFTTKPVGEGSGLGLDIAQKIIRYHQGTIAVRSMPGQTSFTVNLPLKRSPAPNLVTHSITDPVTNSVTNPVTNPVTNLVTNSITDLGRDLDDFEPQNMMQTNAEMQRLMRAKLPLRDSN
ncbi:MAG: hypothetical protein HC771_03945 [Synechococcales cyanobacterium CRU_2_2]|nr:hypothetical protein [Synechococcales cyanobacterium CRU_2_2]